MGEKKRKPGRPAAPPSDLITIDQAVEAIKEFLLKKTGNPVIADKCSLAKGTLRNKTSNGELRHWRMGRFSLVSKAEVLKLVS